MSIRAWSCLMRHGLCYDVDFVVLRRSSRRRSCKALVRVGSFVESPPVQYSLPLAKLVEERFLILVGYTFSLPLWK